MKKTSFFLLIFVLFSTLAINAQTSQSYDQLLNALADNKVNAERLISQVRDIYKDIPQDITNVELAYNNVKQSQNKIIDLITADIQNNQAFNQQNYELHLNKLNNNYLVFNNKAMEAMEAQGIKMSFSEFIEIAINVLKIVQDFVFNTPELKQKAIQDFNSQKIY